MQDRQLSVLARQHQEELRRAARDSVVSGGVVPETGGTATRPGRLRLLDRVLGPH